MINGSAIEFAIIERCLHFWTSKEGREGGGANMWDNAIACTLLAGHGYIGTSVRPGDGHLT
jgi:hypothetical protein